MDMVLLLGVVTGMRCFTGIAAFCWAVWLGLIPELGWAVWSSWLVFAILFTICAAGEWVVDTLPKTPPRTEIGPAVARMVVGGLVGALAATAIDEPVAGGILLGAVGALIGTWGGFFVRMTVARVFRRDLPAALLETASAIGLAIFAVARLHHGIVIELQKAAS
jgi:uncharacterized membrane protein